MNLYSERIFIMSSAHILIANEFSGTDKGRKVLAETEAYFKTNSISYILKKTEYSGHASIITKEAVYNGFKSIFVIGGDGTFNEVVNGLDIDTSHDVSLAFIPSGSGNDFVRNTNLNGTTHQILDYIFNSTPVLVDCCIVNKTKFINICGFGFDVDLAIRQTKIKKYFKGHVSYYLALILSIFTLKYRNITYTIDDTHSIKSDALLIAVGNGSTYGGGFPVTPTAQIQDGIMDVCVVNKIPFFKIPFMLLKFTKGKHLDEKKYVKYFKCKKVHLECNESLPLNVDGEIILSTPCDFEIIPKSIRIYI